MIWLWWEQRLSPRPNGSSVEIVNVTDTMSHGSLPTWSHATVVYNYYAHAQRSAINTRSTQRTVATFNRPRPPISGSPTLSFCIPPCIFRPKGQIECLASSLLHTDVHDWSNSAFLSGTTHTVNGYERVPTTCIMEAPLSLEENIATKWYQFEELMEQFDYRNSLVEFFDRLSSTPVSSKSSSASFSSPSFSSTSL